MRQVGLSETSFRKHALRQIRPLQIPFVERDLQVYDVINADEAYLATTPYCLAPVTKINGLPIGAGVPGPLFARLIAAW